MNWIIRTNNKSKDLPKIQINNVTSAKTYSLLNEEVEIATDKINLNNIRGVLNLISDSAFSISKSDISSIEITH